MAATLEVLRRARREVVLARIAEASFLGIAVTLFAFASAAVAGATIDAAGAWFAAGIAGLAAGVSWWLDQRPRMDELARRVDRKLRLDGALVTAFECERSKDPSPVAALLVEGVGSRLRKREVLRCACPNSLPFLAPPFAAAALLALVIDRAPAPDGAWVRPLVTGVVSSLSNLRSQVAQSAESAELGAEDVSRILALEADAEELERHLAEEEIETEELRDALETLDQTLTELAAELPAKSELARTLEEAQTYADSALLGLEKEGKPPAAPTGPSVEGGAGAGTQGTEETERNRREAGLALANDDANGRISAPLPRPSSSGAEGEGEPTGAAPPPASVGGTSAGRWWPERYSGVVARWVETRRATREGGAESPRPASEDPAPQD